MANKIMMCFDGTCNDPEDAVQTSKLMGLGAIKDNSITNVLKLHLLFGGTLKEPKFNNDMISFYYQGVGTYGSWFDKIKNTAFSPENDDVGKIIKKAVRDLYKVCTSEKDDIYVFGFSRGSAIARRFCAVIEEKFSLIGKDFTPKIKFLGVFDTVAAINKPNLFNTKVKPASDVLFENNTIAPIIGSALHLVALDEKRIAFQPTLMNQEDRVTEIWFPGAHADVGGGYQYDGLSDGALQFMIDWIEQPQFGISVLNPIDVNYNELSDDENIIFTLQDVQISPNHRGKNHEQEALTYIKESFLGDRDFRVNRKDQFSAESPILHRSVIARIQSDAEYIPNSLKEKNMEHPYTGEVVEHKIWGSDTLFKSINDHLAFSKPQPKKLAVNETSAVINVYSNLLFSSSGIFIEKGHSYIFNIDQTQMWFDAQIGCSPSGWSTKDQDFPFYKKWMVNLAEDNRRCPEANWFEIIATITMKNNNPIQILNHQDKNNALVAMYDGELYCYPNDLLDKYNNNLGAITLTVTRVA